ncbi:hypothetical protein [uncultured Georgenia sp.]|uniref:hypothetical protein n=1 Tax=uncultured Georgenia sp. TaxID=378209 RepID=UPI00260A9690|nr:hypothetical protein [uncultured Georgenia sp.]
MAGPGRQQRGGRVIGLVRKVFGPAQLTPVRGQVDHAAQDPLATVRGDWEVRRGADGRTYLVARDTTTPGTVTD